MNRLKGLALAILTLAAIASSAGAVEVKIWTHDQVNGFANGEKDNVAVSTTGVLTLAYSEESLLDEPADIVFDVLPQGDAIIVATGNEGKVFRLADGKTETVADLDDPIALSLARGTDGATYIGTGAEGKVYRMADGKVEPFVTLDARYVWALVPCDDGSLLAATGDEGKIFKIASDGTAEVFYDSPESHILCMARVADGRVYAGADEKGIVYRIDKDGEVRVAYDAAQGEIRALAVSGNGDVYFGTADIGASGEAGDKTAAKASIAQELIRRMTEAEAAGRTGAPVKKAAPEPVVKAVNAVMRILPSDQVMNVATLKQKVVLSLAAEGRTLFIGTGFKGDVYQVDENLDATRIAQLEQGQFTALRLDGERRLIVGTANEAQVFRLLDRYKSQGEYTSPVLNAGQIAQWGALTWVATTPEDTSVKLLTRSGNSVKPDNTWSDWSAPLVDPKGSQAPSPPARFLQYRVVLSTEAPALTPVFRRLQIPYLVGNLAPQVKKIDVPGALTNYAQVQQPAPKKAAKEKKNNGEKKKETPKEKPQTASGQLKIAWQAEDPNKDEMVYTLAFRSPEETEWLKLAGDLKETSYTWNTKTAPDGLYEVRVTASDAPSNTIGNALEDSKISSMFPVDNTPPAIEDFTVTPNDDGTLTARFTAKDTATRIKTASFVVDSGKSERLGPAKGIMDALREPFEFELKDLDPGEHILTVSATDAAGNTVSAKKVIVMPEK